MIFLTEAVLEFGTNLGDRKTNIKNAINAVKKLPETEVISISKFYETEPFGVPDEQNNYINCCAKIKTNLEAQTLLGACLGIEASMGRIRPFKNASRIIDIDLILYGNLKVESRDLILPHPRMLERAFVLAPLLDLYPSGEVMGISFKRNLNKLLKINKLSCVECGDLVIDVGRY